jgi:BirA family biotin operon repressor/biotin-[acetyl-CoA-carboxylase] ligase
MLVKEIILNRLKQNFSDYISGENLSQELNVSRTTVWKYISELRNEGYIIESFPKVGYKLISIPDIITPAEITSVMNTNFIGRTIHFFDEIESTNNYAKKIAYEGCEDGTIVIAEKQTAGRGRLGRTWDSSKGAGIWLSVVLRPNISPQAIQLITLSSSVAVVRAIKDTTGIETGIKWPNDIILDGRKVCGILTEMSSEADHVNHVIIGIGINVNQKTQDFPEELINKAISIRSFADRNSIDNNEITFKRSLIIGRLLSELEEVYYMLVEGRTEEILKVWKEYSIILGKEVVVSGRDGKFTGIAEDLTREGKLVVKGADDTTQMILSGEISLKVPALNHINNREAEKWMQG